MEQLLERTSAGRTLIFKGEGDFFRVLKERVGAHFGKSSRRDDPRLYRKASQLTAAFLFLYTLLLCLDPGLYSLGLCAALGLVTCALGFNVFHDSVHGSFSDTPKVNLVLGRASCALIGISRYLWWYKHNVLHHRFTNIYRWDDDLETRDSLRMSPSQPWKPKYRLQHLYFWALYAMTTLEWIFIKDFVQYFSMKINPFRSIPGLSRAEKLEFWATKAFYLAAFVVLPMALLGPFKALAGLLVFHFTLSLSLAFVFNLAHVMEPAEFPEAALAGTSMETEWAAHQLATTVNFATSNKALTWFAGGLNFQIEHHLFPSISHGHYPELSRIVRTTAREFGLPYHDYPGYRDAVKGHWRILRSLGRKPAAS